MTKKKIYLVSLESNTGTDRVIEDLNARLITLNFNSEIIQPKKILEKYLTGIFRACKSKIPGGQILKQLGYRDFPFNRVI